MQQRFHVFRHLLVQALVVAAAVRFAGRAIRAQPGTQPLPSKEMRDRGHRMLAQLREDLHKYYYDSTYHGVDMEGAQYRLADSAIDAAANNNFVIGALAQYIATLNDSHTNFRVPEHQASVDYGFSRQLFGDSAFVTLVIKDSDAEKKGDRGQGAPEGDAGHPGRRELCLVRGDDGACAAE